MALDAGSGVTVASRRRRFIAKTVLVVTLSVQLALIAHGASDAHKLFAFRPFNESDTWQVEIVRILADGSHRPVDDGTWVYDWDELVGTPRLQHLDQWRHASSGARASVDFLDRALGWVLDHIPDDRDTVALEATVEVIHNGRDPELIVLRRDRDLDR